jgi:ABC-type maltose transport system permease subunit
MVDQVSPELPRAERKSRAPQPQRARWTIGRVLAQAAVVILIIVALFPFLFMLRVALSSARDYLSGIEVLAAPISFENFAAVYGALRRFDQLSQDPRFQIRIRLDAGMMSAFDNRRVLHGRAAFDEQGGRRHFQGCYVEREEVTNRIRVLERGK